MRRGPTGSVTPDCGGLVLAMCNDRQQYSRYVELRSLISVLIFEPAMEIAR